MEITVHKIAETTNSTLSQMLIDGAFFCFVVEDGFREVKEKHFTRIPAGTYPVVPRTYGKFFGQYHLQHKHKFVPELQNVPGFGDILIHKGNTVKDTSGCLLVNSSTTYNHVTKLFEGTQSTPAYLRLYVLLEQEFKNNNPVTIKIER